MDRNDNRQIALQIALAIQPKRGGDVWTLIFNAEKILQFLEPEAEGFHYTFTRDIGDNYNPNWGIMGEFNES